MLHYLKIINLALIHEVELEWHPGFTTVTGETGAGKSVLLGALSLLAGGRADKSQIRAGAETCTVEAQLQFADHEELDTILEAQGLPLCEDGQLLIRRTISTQKGARIHVNGAVTTRTALEQLGSFWIDFHGPGEHQRLFNESHQLRLIDLYANHAEVLDAYREAWQAWTALGKKIESLRQSEKLSPDEKDYLKKQIATIDSVNPEDEVIEQLEQAFQRASHQQELIELASCLEEGLQGDSGVLSQIFSLSQQATSLARIAPETIELCQRLNSSLIDLEDLAAEYAALAGEDILDADSLQQVNERMNAWLDLKRRYGPTPERVRLKRAEFAEKLALQGDLDGTLLRLEKAYEDAHKVAFERAETLHLSRQRAGVEFIKQVNRLLKSLGFKAAKVHVEFQTNQTLHDYGLHRPQLFFQPNPGVPAQPLNKIASSGEAARVMLAIKAVLAEQDATPVLVFDEVDANVGGEVGKEVGRELAELGARHQVLCITHLPQVACQADTHICVVKTQSDTHTEVTIKRIEGTDARIDELARMLGDRKSKTAREHARELLAPK